MKYNYIVVSNADIIDKVYMNNIIIILGELHQLSIRRSHFDHNNSHLNTPFQHKMHLIYVNTLGVNKLEARIIYK